MSQTDLKIGPKIKAFRRQLGLQANRLAEELSISPSYLNLIEGGKRKIDGDLLLKICEKLNIEYDNNGDIAKKGKLIPALLQQLNQLGFYKKSPPKSLGREWVEEFINPIIKLEYETEDLLHTFCEHIAIQIGVFITNESALFTGGGVFNTYLMERIKYYSSSKIVIPNDKIINFKEALIFAFLGVLKVKNEVNCLKSVTGAIRDSCGGIIHNV